MACVGVLKGLFVITSFAVAAVLSGLSTTEETPVEAPVIAPVQAPVPVQSARKISDVVLGSPFKTQETKEVSGSLSLSLPLEDHER